MLKKILCMVIVTIMALATLTVATVGAEGGEIRRMGDVNLDGRHTIKDATAIQKSVAGYSVLSDFQLRLADVNESGTVNVKDATMIQKYLAELIDSDVFTKTVVNGETKEDETLPEDEGIVTLPEEEETTVPETTVPETTAPETTAPQISKPSDKGEVTIPVDEDETNRWGVNVSLAEKAVAERFLELVNEERAKTGAVPLEMHSALANASKIRSKEIIGCWSHTRPDGSSCYTAIEGEHGFGMMGENVAFNSGILNFDPDTLEEDIDYAARFFFGQFKSSEGHYANMIRKAFNCTGVGVEIVDNCCYMAQMFATVYE